MDREFPLQFQGFSFPTVGIFILRYTISSALPSVHVKIAVGVLRIYTQNLSKKIEIIE